MQDTMDALSEVLVTPAFLLWDHVGRTFFQGSNNTVRKEASRDDPPLVIDQGGRWMGLTPNFESLLRLYQAETRRIVLFDKGIE